MARTAALLANFFLGRLPEALFFAEEVCERLIRRPIARLFGYISTIRKSLHLFMPGISTGYLVNRARRRKPCEAARQLARILGHPFMLAFALILGSCDRLYGARVRRQSGVVQEGLKKLAKEHSLWMFEVFGPLWATPAIAARNQPA